MTWSAGKLFGAAASIMLAFFAVTGCGGSPAKPTAAGSSPTASSQSSIAVSAPSTGAPTRLPVEAAPRPTPKKVGITVNPAGAVLPNSARTPGAINPSVTQSDIGQTICVSGWTAAVRPPASVTTRLKKAQLASGYNYQGDIATGDYEEDHLISLELGGAPSAPANLWPEPYNGPEGARVKDQVENRLHALVCAGTITLATAQRAIATNWWIAFQKYVAPQTTP